MLKGYKTSFPCESHAIYDGAGLPQIEVYDDVSLPMLKMHGDVGSNLCSLVPT